MNAMGRPPALSRNTEYFEMIHVIMGCSRDWTVAVTRGGLRGEKLDIPCPLLRRAPGHRLTSNLEDKSGPLGVI